MAEGLDPKVSRRYRELGEDEPPRELDQAILAAAHRAAARARAPLVTPAGRHRWYFAFGAAAILVLAVAITVQLERPQPDPEALQSREQVEPSKPLADAPPPAPEARKAPARQTAPAPSPQADSRDQPSGAAAGIFSRQEARRSREAAPAADAAAARAPQAPARPQAKVEESGVVASVAPPLSPERLLERIAELRKDGRHEEADKALAEFRQRYPDYPVSDQMLKKVERPK